MLYSVVLIAVLGAEPANALKNGDFSTWKTHDGKGITTESVGTPAGSLPDGWYGGPGVGGKATYAGIDFEPGQTDVPGNLKRFFRVRWHQPPSNDWPGEAHHHGDFRFTFLEYFGIQDVGIFSGQTVVMTFWARVDHGELDIVPILWHSYDSVTPGVVGIKGKGYELFESSGKAGAVAVAFGKPNPAAVCRVTTRWTRFQKTITLPSVEGKSITPGHYTGVGFDLDTRYTGNIDIANVDVRVVLADDFETLHAHFMGARDVYYRRLEAAKTDEQKQEILNELSPERLYLPKFFELAEEHCKTPDALKSMAWVCQTFTYNAAILKKATDRLVEDHINDEGLGAALAPLQRADKFDAEPVLRQVLQRSHNRTTQGYCSYYLARLLLTKPIDKDTAARDAEAMKLLGLVTDEFSELAVDGRRLGQLANSASFELRFVRNHTPAPDIVGEDEKGRPFRLSDYRGKVVAITFSGNWCGPCRAMYPMLRDTVTKYKNRPVVLLEVRDYRGLFVRSSIVLAALKF